MAEKHEGLDLTSLEENPQLPMPEAPGMESNKLGVLYFGQSQTDQCSRFPQGSTTSDELANEETILMEEYALPCQVGMC